MKKSISLTSALCLGLAFATPAVCEEVSQDKTESASATYDVAPADDPQENMIPCPFGWSVEPNPSLDNSLNYVTADGALAVSVTSLHKSAGSFATAEAYARVASEQMQCQMPTNSNIVEKGWSFVCPKDGIEAIVYGDENELVMLAISGRTPDTESRLENFIRFLAYEAKNK